MRRGQCQLRGNVSPTFCTANSSSPRRGAVEPSKGDEYLFYVYTGLHRDVRPAGAVFSVAVKPCAAIPASAASLQRHSGHCSDIPDAVKDAQGRDVAKPTTVLRTASCQRHPRDSARAAAGRATSTPPPSKPLLYGHRTRHDASPEAGFARTAIYSMALYTMPPHVGEIVRYDCKLCLLSL
jgi:hypothetical protein